MAYDEKLSDQIRALLVKVSGLVEKKMFGGVGYLVNGNMAFGVHKNALIIRVGPGNYPKSITQPHVHVFDMTGKPMAGWVVVEPEGFARKSDLKAWVEQGLAFARSLPEK